MELRGEAGAEIRLMVQGAYCNKVKGLILELWTGCTLETKSVEEEKRDLTKIGVKLVSEIDSGKRGEHQYQMLMLYCHC